MITHLKGIEFDSSKAQIIFPKLKKFKKEYQVTDDQGNFLFSGLRIKRNAESKVHETRLFKDAEMQRPSVTLNAVKDAIIPLYGTHKVFNSDGGEIGTVEWDGGPIRAVWKVKESGGREVVLREHTPFVKYPFKMLTHLIPIRIDLSAKTGCMEVISDGEIISYISREGSWFNPQYRLVNRDDLDGKIDEQLLFAALALEIQNR